MLWLRCRRWTNGDQARRELGRCWTGPTSATEGSWRVCPILSPDVRVVKTGGCWIRNEGWDTGSGPHQPQKEWGGGLREISTPNPGGQNRK